MAFTLSDLLQGALRKCGVLKVSKTTSGGTTTTLLDSALVGNTSDDDYKYAPLFIVRAPTAGAAPEGEFGEVSAYASATGTFTFPAVSTSVASGTVYAVGTQEFRLDLITQIANDALLDLGDLVNVDVNTITSSANQTEYTLPANLQRTPPLEIDIQYYIASSATRNDWYPLEGWKMQPSSSPGGSAKIVFKNPIPVARHLRVWYKGPHVNVTAYNSAIDERLHPRLAITAVAKALYEYRNSMSRGALPFDVQRLNALQLELEQARAKYPIWHEKRKPKIVKAGKTMADHLPYPPPYGPV